MTALPEAAKQVHANAYVRTLHPDLGIWVAEELGLVFGARGRPIGTLQSNGYVQAQIAGTKHLAHRLIYEAAAGPIPEGWQIDHLNGDRQDNRISNLEPVPPRENRRRALLHRAASPVITQQQREVAARTIGLVTDAELAEDWGVPIESVRAARRLAKKHH